MHQNGFLSPGPPMHPGMINSYVGPGSGLQYLPPMPSPQFVGPNPGMQPHPGLLHPNHVFGNGLPNGHQVATPNGLRRTSNASTPADVFAGPLTPGIPYPALASPLPAQMGLGHPSDIDGQRMRSGSSAGSMSAERRVSIQDTVMRKKPIHGNDSESTTADYSSTVAEADESGVNHGLGVGLVEEAAGVAAATPSPASSKHRKFSLSPSPDLDRVLSRESGSSLSAPSSPSQTSRDSSVSEMHHSVIQGLHKAIEEGQHRVYDDSKRKVKTLTASISDGLLRPKSKSPSLNGDAQSDQATPAPHARKSPAVGNGNEPEQLDSSPELGHTPYFPSMAWTKEENDEKRAEHEAAQEARERQRRDKKANAHSFQNVTIET